MPICYSRQVRASEGGAAPVSARSSNQESPDPEKASEKVCTGNASHDTNSRNYSRAYFTAGGFVRSLFRRRDIVLPLPTRAIPTRRHCAGRDRRRLPRPAGGRRLLRVPPGRSVARLFGLFDLAGRREDTREILIAAQNTFRTLAPDLFAGTELQRGRGHGWTLPRSNRTILQVAGGVRSCPAFIGCYNEDLGTVCYANAGHTPGLLRDESGITQLEASGLPLGIFSHATHSASTCALEPGAMLLSVSRGIVEAEYHDQEFGLEGAKKSLQVAPHRRAGLMPGSPSERRNSWTLLPRTTMSLPSRYYATALIRWGNAPIRANLSSLVQNSC